MGADGFILKGWLAYFLRNIACWSALFSFRGGFYHYSGSCLLDSIPSWHPCWLTSTYALCPLWRDIAYALLDNRVIGRARFGLGSASGGRSRSGYYRRQCGTGKATLLGGWQQKNQELELFINAKVEVEGRWMTPRQLPGVRDTWIDSRTIKASFNVSDSRSVCEQWISLY